MRLFHIAELSMREFFLSSFHSIKNTDIIIFSVDYFEQQQQTYTINKPTK